MLADLSPGDNVLSFFAIRKKELRKKFDSDDFFLLLELGDATGRISASVWDDAKSLFSELSVGDVTKVKGTVATYKGRATINVDKIRKAADDEYQITQFIAVVPRDRDLLWKNLRELISSTTHPQLQGLLEKIFSNENIKHKFYDVPAGKLWHHNYLGGLLEHTLSVTTIALQVAENYPGINRDLLLAAGLLHDIGKIHTYEYRTFIDYTDKGRLVGHIVLGSQLVTEFIREMEAFPEGLETELIHLILSHQGKLEQASPVIPMTLEGLILYYADEVDSKANAFLRIKGKEHKPGQKWSSYVNLTGQYYYFGDED
jgi:3'-5' exoribonuclease